MGSVSTILQSGNQTRVAKAEYRSKIKMQTASNKLAVAQVGLNEFMRTMSNMTQMEAAGKEYNFQREQLAAEAQEAGRGRLNAQLEQAEAQGMLDAMAAANGVGGSSGELMDQLVQLKADTQQYEVQENLRRLNMNGRMQTSQIMQNAIKGQDLRQSFGTFDYTEHIKPKDMSMKWLKLVGVAVATYFGGPQAGEAAADHAVADWKANNGDFDGAGRDYGKALQGAMQAWNDYGQRGGSAWGKDVASGWKIGGGNTGYGSRAPNTKSGKGGFKFSFGK